MREIIEIIRDVVVISALITGLTITIKSIYSFIGNKHYKDMDRVLSNFFIVLVYASVALQLFLFFSASYSYEESIHAIEQIALVIVAVASSQIGRTISIKSNDDLVRFRFRSTFYGIATGLLMYAYFV